MQIEYCEFNYNHKFLAKLWRDHYKKKTSQFVEFSTSGTGGHYRFLFPFLLI